MEWTASLDSKGYGQFNMSRGRLVRAHRYSWEYFNGPVPGSLQLDHLCRNRACVRPDHLEPVTNQENTRRGLLGSVLQVFCANGHRRLPDNLSSSRNCKICKTAYDREYKKRRRGDRSAEG